MPRSSKPRRQYNPARNRVVVNKPRLDSALRVFEPVFAAFDKLASGEIETVRGAPVFKDWSGEWCELAPAIDGWADCWDRICRNQGIDIDLEPLRKLARKLDYGIPLTEDDVSAGRAVIDETRSAFVSLPVEVTRAHAVTEQIQIEVDRLNLKEAA
jgi:hypothetical protein